MVEKIRPPVFQRTTFGLLNFLVEKGYKLQVNNLKNLQKLNDETHKNDPVVVYFNHISNDDPLLITALLINNFNNRSGPWIYPVSEHYTHFFNNPPYALGVPLARSVGFLTPEIIQSYRLRDNRLSEEKKRHLKNLSTKLNKEFIRLLDEKLPEGATFIIAPEGHRSSYGELLPAEDGLGFLAKKMEKLNGDNKIVNGYFLPIGIYYRGIHSREFNINLKIANQKNVVLNVGEIISYKEVLEEGRKLAKNHHFNFTSGLTHLLMARFRDLLPVNMYGVYNPSLFLDTLQGEFRQITVGKKGKKDEVVVS